MAYGLRRSAACALVNGRCGILRGVAVSYHLADDGPPVLPAPAGYDCRGCCAEPEHHGQQGNACPVRVGGSAQSARERLRVALGDWLGGDETA